MKLLSFFIITNLLVGQAQAQAQKESYLQNYLGKTNRFEPKDKFKSLRLTETIEQGLRKNFEQKNRQYNKKLLELEFQDSWEKFYLPQISLSLKYSDKKIARLREGDRAANQANGTLALNLDEYTVFNWGKDYLQYLNTKATFRQDNRNLEEERRSLKHGLIIKYFELLYAQKVLEARKRQLKHASFIYRYNRKRISVKKVGQQEYYQSRSQYLSSQNQYYEAQEKREVLDEKMAHLISDPAGTRYVLSNDLKYITLKLPLKEALELGEKDNPHIQDALTAVDNSKRQYQITIRENLPLPKLSVNLGAYTQNIGENFNHGQYNTGTRGNNIDLVASVSATWALTGPDGFFNKRKTNQKTIEKARSFNQLSQRKHQNNSKIQNHFYRIKHLENQLEIFAAQTVTLGKTFDLVLENYLNRKSSFLNFQDILIAMVNADIKQAQYHFLHTQEKVLLANQIGADDYPGHNFESMAKDKL